MKASILLAAFALLSSPLHAQNGVPPKPVFEGAAETLLIKPSSDQVSASAAAGGITVTIKPGEEGYPGITLTKKDGSLFDFSKHGHVEATVTNLGTKKTGVNLRIDNEGDWKNNPFNAESTYIEPGETGTIKLIFGHSYGHKKGFALNPAAIPRILFFGGKSDTDQVFRIDSFVTAGTPGELPPTDPATIRTKPEDDTIFPTATKPDAEKQLTGENEATATLTTDGILATFPGGSKTGTVTFTPLQGRWDLSQFLQVEVTLKNTGTEPATPKLRLETNGGPSDTIAPAPIPPGASAKVTIPFASKEIWIGEGGGAKAQPGSKVTSDAISKLVLTIENIANPRTLVITSVKGTLPPTPALPEWLGKKPPVEGDWTLSFQDDFNGTSPDATKWNIYANNYWDKASAFSKDNLIVENGFAKLRYEKKTTHHNDDPKQKEFSYTTGFLDTSGKWTQRYGYFETRAKLPNAPGMWPAFWMMPDRGEDSKNRRSTSDGGMEFDIIEHLTRWGPYRTNIAMHWDDYGPNHKSIGSSNIYYQPDKDGFITVGLLWLPGKAAYYINGEEVARWESERMSSVQSILMYTLPQGGWDNNAVDDSKLPSDFTIDYVRAWQRKDLATPGDGMKAPVLEK